MTKRGASSSTQNKRAKTSQKLEVAADAPTIMKDFAQDETPKKGRKLRRTSTEEDVRKCERDNFSGYVHDDYHHYIVNGLSLHQQLSADVHACRHALDTAPTRGKGYYKDLRTAYPMKQGSVDTMLAPKAPEETMDLDLNHCLEGIVGHVKEYTPLNDWFQTSGPPNQRVFVTVCKAMLKYMNVKEPC